jgi:protein-disulfide isomerase
MSRLVASHTKFSLASVALVLAVSMVAADDGADMTVPPTAISPNPADSPVRTQSGKVFASTDADRPPALGPAPAKVLVLVLSDFQCPVCRRSADATQQIVEEFPGEVRAEFWQHALPMHPNAQNAAVASLAAQRQGKFWEYHDALFRNQNALDPASLAHYAEDLGLDVERFKSDYEDPVLRERVKSESAFAETFGAAGTPAFLINGKLYVGWGSWSSFRGNVERELAEARKVEAQGTPLAQVAETRARALITDPEQLQAYVSSVLPTDEPVSKKHKKHKKKRKATS